MINKEFEITKMLDCHLEQVTALEKACFSVPWSLGMFEGELSNGLARYFVAAQSGLVAGYAGMHSVCGEGYVTNIAVAPECRRRGAAKLLLGALIETAVRESLEFLALDVRESNQAAMNLYKGFGFVEMGRRRKYYTDPVEDSILLNLFI